MRTVVGALVFAALSGCGAPRAKLPSTEVLRFSVSYMGKTQSFVVRNDQTADFHDERAGQHGTTAVTADELRTLAAVLRKNDFCSLTSHRSTGVPDEARPSISVRMDGLDCEVRLWDNEFSDDPRASASLRAIEQFGAGLRRADRAPDAPAR